jgi:uncharacterized membrane protein YczE
LNREKVRKMILAVVGILFVGTGIAFNAAASLGNDPIGIVYDGLRNALGLSAGQLGMASNIVNFALTAVVFFAGRRYVNIGTFIYILPYGTVVDLGGKLYSLLFPVQTPALQILGALIGCLSLYFGVAMFIAADIGLDPFTGVVMLIKDKAGKEYRTIKICFDIVCVITGVILGGRLGFITVATALLAGPVIQFFSERIKKYMVRAAAYQAERKVSA